MPTIDISGPPGRDAGPAISAEPATDARSLVVADEAICFHCGLPVTSGQRFVSSIDGVARPMCCAGCRAVADSIVANGLTMYYRQRTSLPSGPADIPPALQRGTAYTLPDVEDALTQSNGDEREAALLLEGVTCAACSWLISERLLRVPGVLGAEVNYTTRRAYVRWNKRRTDLAAVLAAIAAIGYRAIPYDRARAEDSRQRERSAALRRLFVAGFGMMQVMMYVVPMYVTHGEMTPDIEQLMRLTGLLLTLPVVGYSALPFFRGAWRDIRLGQPGMDVPVALGIGAGFVASVWATLSASGAVYFDSITMFVFLLLGARYYEMAARTRAVEAQERLAHEAPALAERMSRWPDRGTAEIVAAGRLLVGDHVRVRPGSRVPADGVVRDGTAEVDEALLTGESAPQRKQRGEAVVGGSINVGSPFVMQVTRIGAQTVLSGMQRMLARAAASRPRIALAADSVARHFIAALLVAACAVAVIWYQIDPQRALSVTFAVLVVSCPCALSLATPAANSAATSNLLARGVVLANADALERLAVASDFVFDKTGTLTSGRLRLVGVLPLDGDASEAARQESLALSAALGTGAEHPVSRAIVAAAPPSCWRRVEGRQYVPGSGVEASVDGVRMRLGTLRYVAGLSGAPMPQQLAYLSDDVSAVALGDERGFRALITVADTVRPDARSVVAELAQSGKKVHLLSGDRPEVCAHVARELGIAHVRGGATPHDKLDYVRALQEQGAVAVMIGDGVNDVAGLARAHVSIAMGTGTDLAASSADLVLMNGRLDTLLQALEIARRTSRIIRQNLAWAFGYNAIAVPLAALGYVTPLVAGAGMAASSLLVVANALRLSPAPARGHHASVTVLSAGSASN